MEVSDGGVPPDLGPTGAISGINGLKNNSRNQSENSVSGTPGKNEQRVKFIYESKDSGPYHVFVENSTPDFKGKLSAIKVNDIIYSVHPELDNTIKEIEGIGRNRVKIIFKNAQSANKLVSTNSLNSYNLEAYIPKFLVVRQGVISGIETDLDENTLKNKIKPFDFHCNFEIFSVKRMTKSIIVKETNERKIIDTKSVIVTFRSQSLPKYVAIGKVRVKVSPYIQRVILCYNCFRYGHSSKQCKSRIRCLICKEEHNSKDCTQNVMEMKCFYCNSNHGTNETKKCAEFSRQKQIKKAMAEQNLTYKEAALNFPNKSYASVTAQGVDPTNINLSQVDLTKRSHPTKSNNNSPTTLKFTQFRTPAKRIRPSSPNPTFQEHNQILSQFNLSQNTGSILNDDIYQENLSQGHYSQNNEQRTYFNNPVNNVNNIVELVLTVLNMIKEKQQTFDINKSELAGIINSAIKDSHK